MQKALSIKQPWADWILGKNLPEGVSAKDVENRTWNTKYRGRFYIHASQKIDKTAFEWFLYEFKKEPIKTGYVTGAIIGSVELKDVFKGKLIDGFYQLHWIMSDCEWWILSNPQTIEPIPAKGKLGFWDCSEYLNKGAK